MSHLVKPGGAHSGVEKGDSGRKVTGAVISSDLADKENNHLQTSFCEKDLLI